jgi:hypothetical protein
MQVIMMEAVIVTCMKMKKSEISLVRGVPLSNIDRSKNNKANMFFALELQL